MKKVVWIGMIVILLFPAFVPAAAAEPTDASGEESMDILYRALPHDARGIMENIDLMNGGGLEQGIAALVEYGKGQIGKLIRSCMKTGAALLTIVFLCNGVQLLYFGEKDSRLLQCTSMTGALAIVLLSAGSVNEMIGLGTETIHTMNDFSKTLLPLLGAACAASGQISAAAVREVGTAFFADLLITCIDRLLVPFVYIYIGAITADAILCDHSLKTIAATVKKCTIWILTALLSIFTAYLTLSGVVSGTADAAALKATRFAISGAVPVVGGILSDAASTLLIGASALKNTIGIFGTLSVFALCLTPFLQIGIQYLLYKASAFFAQTIDRTGLANLMNEIGGAFGMILGMTGACAMLLIISLITSITAVMPV